MLYHWSKKLKNLVYILCTTFLPLDNEDKKSFLLICKGKEKHPWTEILPETSPIAGTSPHGPFQIRYICSNSAIENPSEIIHALRCWIMAKAQPRGHQIPENYAATRLPVAILHNREPHAVFHVVIIDSAVIPGHDVTIVAWGVLSSGLFGGVGKIMLTMTVFSTNPGLDGHTLSMLFFWS